MSAAFDIAITELGSEAAAAIDEQFRRRLGTRQIVEYAYGEPSGWDEFADGGWDLVGASEADGGAGLEVRDLIAFAKVVGRWLPPLPLVETVMAKRWSGAARESGRPVSVGVRTESGRVLIPFGGAADLLVLGDTGRDGGVVPPVVVAQDDYAPSLRLVETDRATTFTPEAARELAIVWAAEAVGCAERVLDVAVDYVKQRQQFGQPIGRFQAVKHHLANALIDSQHPQSAVLWGAADAPRVAPALEIAFDSALRVAEIGVQAHGGMGFTWELGLHVYLRQIVSLRQQALALASVADAG